MTIIESEIELFNDTSILGEKRQAIVESFSDVTSHLD